MIDVGGRLWRVEITSDGFLIEEKRGVDECCGFEEVGDNEQYVDCRSG